MVLVLLASWVLFGLLVSLICCVCLARFVLVVCAVFWALVCVICGIRVICAPRALLILGVLSVLGVLGGMGPLCFDWLSVRAKLCVCVVLRCRLCLLLFLELGRVCVSGGCCSGWVVVLCPC